MALRFRRTFRVFPGVRINLSKGGISTSFGIPGASINVGKHGVRGTVGVPGTGLSYSTNLTPKGKPSSQHSSSSAHQNWSPGQPPSIPLNAGATTSGQPIPTFSGAVHGLTSTSLVQFRDMLFDARSQQNQIKADTLEMTKQVTRISRLEKFLSWPLISKIFSTKRTHVYQELCDLRSQIMELNDWMVRSQIKADFDTSPEAQSAFRLLEHAFNRLTQSHFVWDVTSKRAVNQSFERSIAAVSVDRTRVQPGYAKSDFVSFSGKAMRLPNAINEDIQIYPGVILMEHSDGCFALIAVSEVALSFGTVDFIEQEAVPGDTEVVGHTWAKANKDGSPDRRFANNYQIPVCRYAVLTFTSRSGLFEQFQVSNAKLAFDFVSAFHLYQSKLQQT